MPLFFVFEKHWEDDFKELLDFLLGFVILLESR